MANLFINMENVISRRAKCGAERSDGGGLRRTLLTYPTIAVGSSRCNFKC